MLKNNIQLDSNVENYVTSSSSSSASRKLQKTYERYVRAESSRKALVYQKKYLLLIIGGFQETESTTLRLISRMSGQPNPQQIIQKPDPKTRFKSAVRVVIAISRLIFLTFLFENSFLIQVKISDQKMAKNGNSITIIL